MDFGISKFDPKREFLWVCTSAEATKPLQGTAVPAFPFGSLFYRGDYSFCEQKAGPTPFKTKLSGCNYLRSNHESLRRGC